MPRLAILAAFLAVALPSTTDARSRAKGVPATLTLDGTRLEVRWTDGDTFRIVSGPFRGVRARVIGFNTLETFGPVHRWGRWRPEELLAIARGTAKSAAARTWTCRRADGRDQYGRLKVACPDLARALVGSGEALVLAMDEPADPALVAAQREAQRRGAGIWAKGVPAVVVTTARSADEPGLGRRGAYTRVADTRTGATRAIPHRNRYAPCEEVCAGEGDARSCFVYVPPDRRRRDPPACVREPPASAR